MADRILAGVCGDRKEAHRATLLVGICLIAVSVYLHTQVAGWGTLSPSPTSPWTTVGIVYYPCDNLSYCAWAQQARQGNWRFSDLYTTTPHRALLVNPFFGVVGWLTAVFQTTPMLILNLATLACVPLFLGSLSRIYRALGFRASTSFLALCLALGGGGISWIRSALSATGLHELLYVGEPGPDLFYYDLYPAVAFCSFPYHAISLTMLAVVAAMIVTYEDLQRAFSAKQWLMLALASAALVSTRPYEAPVLLGSYFLAALAAHLAGTPRETRRRRRRILSSLGVGILPFGGYSLWVATQPVWREFAQGSFNVHGNVDWAGGFLILWILAAVGVFVGSAGCLTSPRALFFVWAMLCAVLLIVLSAGVTKLCGGVTIPLSVAAGVAIDWMFAANPRGWKLKLAVVALAFCALASPLLSVYRQSRDPGRIPTDLLHALAAIQADTNVARPTVLTGSNWGPVVPGLFGFRVYCGHWTLTDECPAKASLLALLGFRERNAPIASDIDLDGARRQAGILLAQLKDNVIDYVVLASSYVLSEELRPDALEQPIYSGPEYRAFRMGPGMRGQLAERLRAIAPPRQ